MFQFKAMLLLALGAVLCLGQLALAEPGANPPQAGDRLAKLTQALTLTADQQAKVKTIFENERTQVLAVLTPDQQAKAKQTGGADLKSLGLTADQQTKIEGIRKASLDALRAILTPDQQTKFDAMHKGAGGQEGDRLTKLTQALTLTTDQQAKAKSIFEDERTQVLAVLTPDQQAKLQQEGKGAAEPLKSLGLTADQQTKVQGIRKASMDAFRAILTADQQTKFDAMHQGAGQKQGHNGSNSGRRSH